MYMTVTPFLSELCFLSKHHFYIEAKITFNSHLNFVCNYNFTRDIFKKKSKFYRLNLEKLGSEITHLLYGSKYTSRVKKILPINIVKLINE